jgi:hypothetical protein
VKKGIIHPLVAGIFAAIVTIGYGMAYEKATAIEGDQLESLREAIPMLHLFIRIRSFAENRTKMGCFFVLFSLRFSFNPKFFWYFFCLQFA